MSMVLLREDNKKPVPGFPGNDGPVHDYCGHIFFTDVLFNSPFLTFTVKSKRCMKRIILCLLLSIALLALNINLAMLCIIAFDLVTFGLALLVAGTTTYLLYKGIHKLVYRQEKLSS